MRLYGAPSVALDVVDDKISGEFIEIFEYFGPKYSTIIARWYLNTAS